MKIHPSQQQLSDYSEGLMDDVSGFTIAIHLEQCLECKRQVADMEVMSADLLFNGDFLESKVQFNDSELEDMLAAITSVGVADSVQAPTSSLEQFEVTTPNGRTFMLPKALSRHAQHIGDWRNYGGKVYSANIALDTKARINLLYINQDAQVPQHTHKGEETTIILHGGFSDEDGHYHAGDFLVRDASHKHAPHTKVGEDCLCLTVLTEPMIFTQGVARIFNLFGKGMYP
ncbi:ChrR family anti-sigma-E factor [Vibrio sp. FNV 38]|nr:ChrR family anti-sigma-E factor [Vibrio sp. FNV 38]